MKSRQEFDSEKDWLEYLRSYFAAMRRHSDGEDSLSLSWAKAIMGEDSPPPNDVLENIKWWTMAEERYSVMKADALIKALNESK